MKKNSKLMLLATSLLTVSIAASATSAYAWYTANKISNVHLNQIEITSASTALGVNPILGEDFVADASDGNGESKETPRVLKVNDGDDINSKHLTDVTSDGMGTFAKPKFSPDCSEIVGWYSDTQANKFGFHLTIEFTATGPSDLQLYLDNSSIPTAGSTNDLNAEKALRYSVTKRHTSDDGKDLVLYANPLGPDSQYIPKSYTGPIAENGGQQKQSTNVANNVSGNLFHENFVEVTQSRVDNRDAAHGYLGLVPKKDIGEEKLTLDFHIWVEGTDPDATFTNPVNVTKFTSLAMKLALNFYAIEYNEAADTSISH